MIDISKGRYWDLPWSLVDGCTPCSPGCDHCWALAMEKRFRPKIKGQDDYGVGEFLIDDKSIITHPERLSIPLKLRKPTVYAVWNDLFHEAVLDQFRIDAYRVMVRTPHTYLILTKRQEQIASFVKTLDYYNIEITTQSLTFTADRIYHGLTVCNQQEADEKIPVFLQVPGKKFLSLEPLLGPIDLGIYGHRMGSPKSAIRGVIDAVILGGETGPGSRPMHPDWVRSVRNQCATAEVSFFLKSLGEWSLRGNVKTGCEFVKGKDGRLLDGRTHDDLPWNK